MSIPSKVYHRFSDLSLSLSSRHTLHLSSPQLALASPLRLHRKRFSQRTMKSSKLATPVPFCSSAAEHSVPDFGASPSTSSPVQEDEGCHSLTTILIRSDLFICSFIFVSVLVPILL
jgi:hypothetical protein